MVFCPMPTQFTEEEKTLQQKYSKLKKKVSLSIRLKDHFNYLIFFLNSEKASSATESTKTRTNSTNNHTESIKTRFLSKL